MEVGGKWKVVRSLKNGRDKRTKGCVTRVFCILHTLVLLLALLEF